MAGERGSGGEESVREKEGHFFEREWIRGRGGEREGLRKEKGGFPFPI